MRRRRQMRRRRLVEFGKRLSQEDHREIQKRISAGSTFATAAVRKGATPRDRIR